MADVRTDQNSVTDHDADAAEPMNRAERRAQRKGKNADGQQRQFGIGSEQHKDNRSQVIGQRQFSGRRGNR